MTCIKPGSREYPLVVAALFLGGFVTFANLYSTQTILPTLVRQFHVTPVVGSLSVSLTTGALAVCMLVTPVFSDRAGRRVVMTVSLAATGAFSLLAALAPSFGTLLVLRFLQGAVLAGFPAIAMGYIGEVIHPGSLGRVMGIYIGGTSIGGMTGRFMVGALTDLFSWHVALVVLGVLSMVISFYFGRMLPPATGVAPAPFSLARAAAAIFYHLKDPALLGLYAVGFILMGGFVSMFNYVGFLLMAPPYHLSQTLIGFIYIVYLGGTFSSAWVGRLADRLPRSLVLAAAVISMGAGATVTLAPLLVVKILGLVLFAAGFFAGHSVASGWVNKRATINKSQASSLYLFFYYLGSSVIGSAGGLFWSRFGWPGVIANIDGVLVLAVGMAFLTAVLAARHPLWVQEKAGLGENTCR
ncbi:MAG: MFS transporter [Peptococcaceae bacterium]|nr:MFS transporter [Peptococcaceae bacterium]